MQFTDGQKVIKNWLKQYTDCMKKQKIKKYLKVGIELSINDNTKTLKYKPCLSFQASQKRKFGIYWLIQFTDQHK